MLPEFTNYLSMVKFICYSNCFFQVNLDAVPQAQLNQQVYYGDPNYCSVYIGMETIGIPYLYEIQVVKVIKD